MKKVKLGKKAYDKAFNSMYKSLLRENLSSVEFNKRYEDWVNKNAPKYDLK